jgi:hypothetical protein
MRDGPYFFIYRKSPIQDGMSNEPVLPAFSEALPIADAA